MRRWNVVNNIDDHRRPSMMIIADDGITFRPIIMIVNDRVPIGHHHVATTITDTVNINMMNE
jgi:hypothetical protein